MMAISLYGMSPFKKVIKFTVPYIISMVEIELPSVFPLQAAPFLSKLVLG